MRTTNELTERLLECDYPKNDKLISDVIAKIQNFGVEAKKMFEEWYDTSTIQPFDVDGITPAYLRKHHKMKDVGIIIAYDWLKKDTKQAARALKKPVILSKK